MRKNNEFCFGIISTHAGRWAATSHQLTFSRLGCALCRLAGTGCLHHTSSEHYCQLSCSNHSSATHTTEKGGVFYWSFIAWAKLLSPRHPPTQEQNPYFCIQEFSTDFWGKNEHFHAVMGGTRPSDLGGYQTTTWLTNNSFATETPLCLVLFTLCDVMLLVAGSVQSQDQLESQFVGIGLMQFNSI